MVSSTLKNIFFFIIFSFVGLLVPAVALADQCQGYSSQSANLQTGFCVYYKDNSTPDYKGTVACSNVFSCHDTHFAKGEDCSLFGQKLKGSANYHNISDDVKNCLYNYGGPYYCCAQNDIAAQQDNVAAPPPPCITDSNGVCHQVSTGLGVSIQVDPASIIGDIFNILLGISGGIVVVIIIFSGYRIMFAQADPEKLKGAREALTSAIIGLLFIIFSIVILRIIGIDILHIPGLSL